MWTGYMDIVGAFFIRADDHGVLARKLVNMPNGMFTVTEKL